MQKKGAHQIPGVAGSGIERGEAAAVAQVSATLRAVGGSHRSMGLEFLKAGSTVWVLSHAPLLVYLALTLGRMPAVSC